MKKIIPILLLIIILQTSGCFWAVVKAGHVGVQDTFGEVDPTPLQSGWRWKNFFTNVHNVPVQTREIKEAVEVLSKEGLTVQVDLSLLYHLTPDKAPEVYRDLSLYDSTQNPAYENKFIIPNMRSMVREIAAEYEAKTLHTEGRQLVSQQLLERLKPTFDKRGFILEQILLRKVSLPEKIQEAIQNKLNADQENQAMEFIIEKERKEAERKAIEAEGIKEAQAIIDQTLTPEYLTYKWIESLPNHDSVIYVSTEGNMPIFKNVDYGKTNPLDKN